MPPRIKKKDFGNYIEKVANITEISAGTIFCSNELSAIKVLFNAGYSERSVNLFLNDLIKC